MGMTLEAARINAKLTQEAAAQKIGVTRKTLGNWEKGLHFPTVPFIKKIESTYNVNYRDINFYPKNTLKA